MIRVDAFQAYGVPQVGEDGSLKLVQRWEFCCWDSLYRWLSGFKGLHRCADCGSERGASKPHEVFIRGFRCLRCGYEWVPRIYSKEDGPGRCPRCKSPSWKTPPRFDGLDLRTVSGAPLVAPKDREKVDLKGLSFDEKREAIREKYDGRGGVE